MLACGSRTELLEPFDDTVPVEGGGFGGGAPSAGRAAGGSRPIAGSRAVGGSRTIGGTAGMSGSGTVGGFAGAGGFGAGGTGGSADGGAGGFGGAPPSLELSCPTGPDDPRLPVLKLGTPTALDGSRFVSGDVKTWHWTLVREDCDAVVADPEFVLQGGERPVLMFQAVRPSNYHFTLKVVGAAGDSGSCKFDVPTDGRGMRVELCWDTSQNTDLYMYLHNPFDRAPWFTAGVGMLADGINGTTCNVANCTANLRLGLRALISVSPIRHSRTAKLARRLMNSKRSAAVPIRATAKTTTSR